MPPPEGSGILTLYGHRLPRLYRRSIESRMHVTAKSMALVLVVPTGAVGRSQKRFYYQVVGRVRIARSDPS